MTVTLEKAWFASILLIAGASFAVPGELRASDQVGTLTLVQGEVKLFTDPSKSLPSAPPRALFEGEYYTVVDAKVGDRIRWGNVLRTAPGARAKVVFDNGDQFTLGPGSSYRAFWDKDSPDGKPRIELSYGQFRGVVAKGGPRSRFNIRTRSATMGVRGTDFYVEAASGGGETQLSVLRGAVEMKAQSPEARPVEVKAGFSGEVTIAKGKTTEGGAATGASAPEETPPASGNPEPGAKPESAVGPALRIDVRRTSQDDLVVIQKSTSVARSALQESAAQPAPSKPEVLEPETRKQVEALEKKAVESTLKDIQAADPKLYAELTERAKTAPISSSEVLSTATLQNVAREAPKAPPVRRKIQRKELEDIAPTDYDKYFEMLNK